jgi:H+/Cl- antiporter ClcA
MKDKFLEGTVLFISIVKWIILASGVGFVIGIATAVFLRILQATITFTMSNPYYFCLLPLGLFLSAILVQYVAKEVKGYGTEKVIEAVHKHAGRIRAVVIPVKLAATIVTAGVGGSVGQIGPCAQIGGGLASLLADVLQFDENDRKKLIICGISAGFSSVLGAPISGAIFGVEVLSVGSILYEVLLPSFIAGIVSYHTSYFFGINYFHYPAQVITEFTDKFLLINAIAGIFFGLCARLVIECVKWVNNVFEKIRIWPPLKGIIGGVILVTLAFVFSTRYLGLGIETVQEALRGVQIASTAFLMKTIFTSVTFASGGSGGIIAPILFIGATAGSFFGDLVSMDRATFAAIGFVSVLAGAANAPISMSILAIELFGKDIGSYAAMACIISFLITGHRSIFPTQVITMRKSSSLDLEIGQELNDIRTKYKFREKSIIGRGIKIKHKFKKSDKEKE